MRSEIPKEHNIYNAANTHSIPYAYFLEKGVCALTSFTKEGDEKVYLYFKPKRMVGFTQLLAKEYENDNYYSEFSIKAKTDCTIYRISEKLFFEMIEEDREFNRMMMNTTIENYVDVLNRFQQMHEESATTRLCRFLLTHSEESGAQLMLPKYFTYVEMARYLGTHPVTVARIMAKLKQQACISKKGHCVIVNKKERLESILNDNLDLEY